MSGEPVILYTPDVALEKIFSYLSYDEIAKNRIVCRKFNEVGSRMLSMGFMKLEKRHAGIYKRVKSLLPRRESERRAHPLARHCDILQAVETRISMLNMTYMKYIENNLLCFIPGKVLDEMRNVLNMVESDFTPPRTHMLLQELRDLSSMAMEHFDEHILPRVKEHREQIEERRQAIFATISGPQTTRETRPFFLQQINDLQKIKKQYKSYKHHIMYLNKNTQKLIQKMRRQNTRLKAQSMKIREQERKLQEQTAKIQEQESAMADIKKHMDEWDQKYKDLTTELVRVRDDFLLKSVTPQKSTENAVGASKFFKPTIRPRTAQIVPKSFNIRLDLERKRKSALLPEIPLKRTKDDDKAGDVLNRLKQPAKEQDSENKANKSKSKLEQNFNYIIENLIKSPLKSRKRKMTEELDLNV